MTPDPQALLAHCVERQGGFERVLEALVRTSSGSDDMAGNRRCMEILADGFDALGFETAALVSQSASQREHLFCRRTGREGAPVVLLLGHTDTVYPEGDPFHGFWFEDGRARGPGVADMKGGLCVMLAVADALVAAGVADDLELRVFVNTDEEQGSPTSRPSIHRLAAEASLVLVFESGRADGSLVTSRRGAGRFRIEVAGKPAHAGNDLGLGRNAIVALAPVVTQVAAMNDAARGISVNVGVISGGTRANVVAERASLMLDVRCDDESAARFVEAKLNGLVGALVLDGVEASLEGAMHRPPWQRGAGTDALVELWQGAARDLGVEVPQGVHAGGGSDGNFTSSLGVPTLDGLGAWGGDYHTPAEWMDPATMPGRAAMTALAVCRWLEVWATDPRLSKRGVGGRPKLVALSGGVPK
ncbi:MAG: M20 family metallopeptidase [Myxococcota bacterium]